MFHASQSAVKGGRRSQVFEGSVANTTSKFRYYVPHQWQGSFDQYIEVSECEALIKVPSSNLVNSRVSHAFASYIYMYLLFNKL